MKQIHFGTQTLQLTGNPSDRYFQDGFSSDGFQSCGSYLQKILTPGMVCFDVGANIGLTALAFGTLVGKAGQVFAFEPSPKNFRYLEENSKINGYTQIHPIQKAIGKESGTLSFFETQDFGAGSFVSTQSDNMAAQHHQTEKISVPMTSVDEFVEANDLTRVDFIKVDVEGFEGEVLEGAKKTLAKFHPIVVLEFNPYCLVSHMECLPTHFLQKVFTTFNSIHVHYDAFDTIGKVEDIHDRHRLLHDGFLYHVVNLICSFEAHPLVGLQDSPKLSSLKLEKRDLMSKIKRILRPS